MHPDNKVTKSCVLYLMKILHLTANSHPGLCYSKNIGGRGGLREMMENISVPAWCRSSCRVHVSLANHFPFLPPPLSHRPHSEGCAHHISSALQARFSLPTTFLLFVFCCCCCFFAINISSLNLNSISDKNV